MCLVIYNHNAKVCHGRRLTLTNEITMLRTSLSIKYRINIYIHAQQIQYKRPVQGTRRKYSFVRGCPDSVNKGEKTA